MADSGSGKGEPSDKVCEVVEALTSFISDEWKRFGDGRTKNKMQTLPTGPFFADVTLKRSLVY